MKLQKFVIRAPSRRAASDSKWPSVSLGAPACRSIHHFEIERLAFPKYGMHFSPPAPALPTVSVELEGGPSILHGDLISWVLYPPLQLYPVSREPDAFNKYQRRTAGESCVPRPANLYYRIGIFLREEFSPRALYNGQFEYEEGGSVCGGRDLNVSFVNSYDGTRMWVKTRRLYSTIFRSRVRWHSEREGASIADLTARL